jgi:hypothetical protein
MRPTLDDLNEENDREDRRANPRRTDVLREISWKGTLGPAPADYKNAASDFNAMSNGIACWCPQACPVHNSGGRNPEPPVVLNTTATIGEYADYLHEHTRDLECGDADCPINSGEREPDWGVLGMILKGVL